MKKLFLSVASLLIVLGSNCQEVKATEISTEISIDPFDSSHRPQHVKAHIDEAFEIVSQQDPKRWHSNGQENYQMLSTNQDNITIDSYLKSRINAGQTDINIMDIGAGNGAWGHALADRINQFSEVSNVHINIYSLTGEKYDAPETTENGKCFIHNLYGFKIEDLDKELNKKNLDLNNKIDLIVSYLTFTHLYDRLGTLQTAINLMRPNTGIMINQWSPLNLLKDENAITSLEQQEIDPYHSLSYFYDAAIESELEIFISALYKSFKNYILKKKTSEEILLPFKYSQNQYPENEFGCYYVVKKNSYKILIPRITSSGGQAIYDEMKGYNPKFNEIYDETPQFKPLSNQ
ncbi:MAG: methyltransferase domain-containing protein [Janthinobacterium lividum]